MMKIRNKSGIRKGMKRYARRKARGVTSTLSGRYLLSNDVTRAQIELYDLLVIPSGTSGLVFASNTANYKDIEDILANSTSFQDLFPIYARYKITGLSMRCSVAQDNSYITSKIGSGFPTCSAAFYPNLTNVGIGTNPSFNDHKLILESGVTNVQSKYWKFPDNYFEASGTGFGVWSQCNGYTNQVGQISVAANKIGFGATADCYLFNVRLTLYVMFSDKNR